MVRQARVITSTFYLRLLAIGVAILFCVASVSVHAQTEAALPDAPSAQALVIADQAISPSPTVMKDCVEPDPTFTGLEYNGPFKKLVVHLAGKPDIRTVHLHEGQG